MIEIFQIEVFSSWFHQLKDIQAKARIGIRLDRLRLGWLGDVKPVGKGVCELRIDQGPGYRIYFLRRGHTAILLLAGGDKRTQDRDIKVAIEMMKHFQEQI